MKFIAKTLFGLEPVLEDELKLLGAENIRIGNRAVYFEGDKKLLYRANYCVRTALSFLMPVGDFFIKSKEDLYKEASTINWDKYLSVDHTFSVVSVVNTPLFSHTGYAGLVVKDAIADYFRKKTGKRPSVDAGDPDILINLHISNNSVTISIDSSVVPLFKRGYRKEQSVAPLNEVLAAGILYLSGWKASSDLVDPMCGSGTIPIEAALMACRIPPGKFRDYFGFQRWKDYDENLFSSIKKECESEIISSGVKISGYDISEEALLLSKANIKRAGLQDVIEVNRMDFKDLNLTEIPMYLFLNPPYGERLNKDETDELYNMIGSTLKHNFSGTTAWLITSNRESLKKVGLKPAKKITLFNGALECTLLKYEMYQGSKKKVFADAPK